MSETSGESYLDQAGMHSLSVTLTTGAAVLDETATLAPHAPDAGVSTLLVGELLAGMSRVVSDLVIAVDVTSVSLRHSDETFASADVGSARQFGALGE